MIQIDTREFSRTLARYMEHTKRDLAYVINAKGFYIARGAARYTMKADPIQIKKTLTEIAYPTYKGKTREAPMAGVMAEMWAKKKFGSGVSPGTVSGLRLLRALVKQITGARMRARAFMRSGWLPAIKKFKNRMDASERFIAGSAALTEMGTNQFPNPLGGCDPAKPGFAVQAILWNASVAKRTQDPGMKLSEIAGTALQKAVADETTSMQAYVERKLQGTSNRYSGRR